VFNKGEIARGMQGAIRLLQRDPAAPLYFDNTLDACLRSFRVMALVAPLYLLYVVISYSGVEVTAEPWEIGMAEGLRYIVEWLLYPVLFYEIARRRRWLDRYPRYIAALNWVNLPATLLMLIDVVVVSIAPSPFSDIFDLGVFALGCFWIAITTRLTLNVSWLMTVLLLIVNVVPSLFLSLVVSRFLGVPLGN